MPTFLHSLSSVPSKARVTRAFLEESIIKTTHWCWAIELALQLCWANLLLLPTSGMLLYPLGLPPSNHLVPRSCWHQISGISFQAVDNYPRRFCSLALRVFLYAEAMTKHYCFLPQGVLEMCTDFTDAKRGEFQRYTLRSMVRLVPSSGPSMEARLVPTVQGRGWQALWITKSPSLMPSTALGTFLSQQIIYILSQILEEGGNIHIPIVHIEKLRLN